MFQDHDIDESYSSTPWLSLKLKNEGYLSPLNLKTPSMNQSDENADKMSKCCGISSTTKFHKWKHQTDPHLLTTTPAKET